MARSALLMSLVKMAACKPNDESLASSIALVERVVGGDGHDRTEHLHRAHLHVGLGVGDDRRGAARRRRRPLRPVSDLGAGGFCLGHPRHDAIALAVRDQRRHIGRLVERVADHQRVDMIDQARR